MIFAPRFARTRILALALLAFTVAAETGYVGSPVAADQSGSYETITTGRLAQMLENKDFLLVNVHIPYEGEIAQTDAFIPFDLIGANLDLLPADKSAPIVLYCRSGRMSEVAAGELTALGYTNVSHVAGGMTQWAKDGQQVLDK